MIISEKPSIDPKNLVKSSNPLKNWIGQHLVETIGVSVGVSLVLLGGSAWQITNAYLGFKDNITKQFKLESLSGEVGRLDEVLTMSARLAASTGSPKWEERYHAHEPELDKVLQKIDLLAPSFEQETQKTQTANEKLVEMEGRAFELIRSGKKNEALKLLLGSEYEVQKEVYSQGLDNALSSIHQETDTQIKVYSDRLRWSLWFAGISFPILIGSWAAIGFQVKNDPVNARTIPTNATKAQ